jgi:hypothetical protein
MDAKPCKSLVGARPLGDLMSEFKGRRLGALAQLDQPELLVEVLDAYPHDAMGPHVVPRPAR